ncbi:HesB/YadR/YfhF family protein [Peribacillus simplex]|uniref:HesB/YadR/YfhF family protein n=1 Tax=Peribacillus simplex TaxID=1478 RepID=UPI0025A237EA|nr:HesB/YadR/YfhF family protein [Peribacillus simplex]MDM5294919.1 HesB/YadR/YfhF family protein [Peribacillus simplex]
MKLTISDQAAKWYIDELGLQEGSHLRFYVRYGGHSSVQSGFSLGIMKEEPETAAAVTTMNDINFYVEEKDLWYFDGHDLLITFNEKLTEPEFHYEKSA